MTLFRMQHDGAAPTTGVASSFNSSAATFTILSGTGYPDGSVGPFILKIDAGTASEEKILCLSRSGTTVTVYGSGSGRGYDGTSATSHSAGVTNVEHDLGAIEIDDANDHIYTTSRDDHTQYARTDGTRAITGTQTFSDGAIVTTGGFTVSAGGMTVHGNSTFENALTCNAGFLAQTVSGGLIQEVTGRFVGSVGTTGAPSSGTFLAQDWCIDSAGIVWTCVTGGTPGTWTPPVGYMIAHATGPGSTTNFSTSAAATSPTGAVIDGFSYWIEGRVLGTQITSNSGITIASLSTDDGVVSGVRFISQPVTVSTEAAGGGGTLYVPTATRTTTFTLNISSTASFQVGANAAELTVTRVA